MDCEDDHIVLNYNLWPENSVDKSVEAATLLVEYQRVARVSDEWSRDLKSVQVQKQLSCRDESPDPSMSKIVLRNLIFSSKYYKEEEAKELLEVITAERLETEQRQKLEQEQLSIEKLRLEMELSRIANQSANQNNGQTSRVKSLDEIVKMVLGS
ncbi:hypothetical protein TNCV_2466771 [Trichonephila clavipes]|nr:hypothetical protein TNCV_2466771 [Trichonephila clavipes]